MAKDVLLAGSVRTAIGSYCGVYSEVPATELGSKAIQASLERSGVDPAEVKEVIFGNVLSAGCGQNVARQAAIGAGLDVSVGATTVNKMCGSGLKAAMLGAQAVQCGDADVVVAGGTENMTRAPYLLEKARMGYRMGDGVLVDSMLRDGLIDSYDHTHMGVFGDKVAERYGFSREDQDRFAVASYKRAIQAAEEGVFKQEIVPVDVKVKKETRSIVQDEEPTRFSEEKMPNLRPVFDKQGTVTAGNASSINDGAAAVVVIDADRAEKLGVNAEARIVGYSTHSREPEWFTLAPIGAIQKLMEKLSWSEKDVDLFEVNEAFAGVTLAAMKDLGLPHEKVNVHGGAVALGHPIGASGARILATLLNAMKQRDGKRGIASLCIGGGEAVAMAIERL